MAELKFSYSYTQVQLKTIINMAIKLIVYDDLERYEIREHLMLHYLLNERGCGHEAGFDIDAYPPNKNEPVSFYIIQGEIFGCSDNNVDIAIYSPQEIKEEILSVLSNFSESESKYVAIVNKIVEQFHLK